ncbi:MAG: hypothetical protein KDB68_13730 [Planctomycetes bacterium]|nr:hypothetical protein [Planctomycetota bacterium]
MVIAFFFPDVLFLVADLDLTLEGFAVFPADFLEDLPAAFLVDFRAADFLPVVFFGALVLLLAAFLEVFLAEVFFAGFADFLAAEPFDVFLAALELDFFTAFALLFFALNFFGFAVLVPAFFAGLEAAFFVPFIALDLAGFRLFLLADFLADFFVTGLRAGLADAFAGLLLRAALFVLAAMQYLRLVPAQNIWSQPNKSF